MIEMTDLRGSEMSWLLSRRSPFLCHIRSGAGAGGHLVTGESARSLVGHLANVRWTIVHQRSHDEVAFEDGPKIADARTWAGGYEVEIDGLARYSFGLRKEQATNWNADTKPYNAWIDGGGRHAVLFKSQGHGVRSESGEIVASSTAILEHVPILVILGIVHLTMR